MGKVEGGVPSSSGHSGGRRKNKSRIDYLKRMKRGGSWGGGGRGGGGGGYVSAYGRDGQKKRPKPFLTAGMKGFLLSTNFREQDCVRDGYNLLNEYYRPEIDDEKKEEEVVQGAEGMTVDEVKCEEGGGDEEEDEDIDKALSKEIKQLQSREGFKFNAVDTKVKNIVFIKTAIKDPTALVYRIFDDVLAKKEAKSRHILRFLPVEGTCYADLQTIKTLAKEIFTPYFKSGLKAFKIVPSIRYNSTLKNMDVIKVLAEAVDEINPLNVVNLNEPEFTIVIEVLQTVACLCVLRDFVKYKKFNITEIVSPSPAPVVVAKPETVLESVVSACGDGQSEESSSKKKETTEVKKEEDC